MTLIKAVKFINSIDMAKKIRINKKKLFVNMRNHHQVTKLQGMTMEKYR